MNTKLVLLFIASACAVDIPCPGGKKQCPDDATCCPLPDESYGCCPDKDAVCCDDHIHCCPSGTKCDSDLCIQQHFNISGGNANEKDVCPGGKYTCPDQSTCCLDMQGKEYGCCLMPNAVCCNDGQHCCPEDTVCDAAHRQCTSKNSVTQIYNSNKLPAEPHISENMVETEKQSLAKTLKKKIMKAVICPGGTYQCPDGYTCCQLPSEGWGCCPYADATCCADKLHCCPSGLKCDETSSTCIQGNMNITWSENIPALLDDSTVHF